MEKNTIEQAASNGDEQHETDPVDVMDEEDAAKEKLTSFETIKFVPVSMDGANYDGKNGDAKVDIIHVVAHNVVGMGKEELMKYANEPFWVRLRMFLFVFFWVAWLAMLIGAVVIIILAPRCPPPPKVEWYQKTAMYQVDVKNFKDSDGNGVGDFKGLTSKLEYFKKQHIESIMLSSFYKSDANGIIDHKAIDVEVGTLEDFNDLVKQLKENDIKVVIDFNPNHSSDKHNWFIASQEGQEPYNDYYIWADASENGMEPNNWLNIDGESAWTWSNNRKQYYLQTFGQKMPELNLRNELVKQELKEIIEFWLEKGVDGFKVVAASHLIENANLRDEPVATAKEPNKPKYQDINHIYTVDQTENLGLFAQWKAILSNFTASAGIPKILMPEVSGSMNTSALYYGNDTAPLAELPFSNHFTHVNYKITGIELKEHLEMWNSQVPVNGWPTILIGSGSAPRLASRVGEDLVDAIHMVAVFTKGTPITYYADELGVTDIDQMSRNKKPLTQTVMLWTNETLSGFSNGSSSLHVHPKYQTLNVQVQEANKQSHLKIFSRLLSLRGQPALNFGAQHYPIVTEDIFSLMRVRKGSPGYLVLLNLGRNSTVVDFTGKNPHLPATARVEIRSGNIESGPLAQGDHPKITLDSVPLDPKQAVVFSFVPIFEG